MSDLIDVAQCQTLRESGASILLDCRFSLADPAAGRQAYLDGHIPGARYADLEADLSAPVIKGQTGRHPLPAREHLRRRVGAWGITPASTVVVYDDAAGAMAARAWWLLRWLGHDKVMLLDGGLRAWQQAGLPLETGAARSEDVGPYPERAPLTRQVERAELESAGQVLLDARDRRRYLGEEEPIDPVAGHIPGALCRPFNDNLGAGGRFKAVPELRHEFKALVPEDKQEQVVCYCGSGVTACHNILALKLAGFPEPALYPGSWSEWILGPRP